MPHGQALAGETGRRRLGAATLAALAVGASGCASVRVHGVVDDPGGRPIENARISLLAPGQGEPAAAPVTSDARGCFFVYGRAGSETRPFRLTVDSPGHKPATATVPPRRLIILRVVLAGEAGADGSTAVPIPRSERPLLYEARCEPAANAGSISLHQEAPAHARGGWRP